MPAVQLRSFDDIDGQRQAIYDYAAQSFTDMKPLESLTHRLEVADVGYDDDYRPTLADEKEALFARKSLQRALRGTVRLYDNNTGAVVDERRMTLAHIPHLTNRGLFIRRGVSWALRNQERLRPGVYTRRRSDGATEAQFNVNRGRGFRVRLDSKTGQFRFDVGQSTTRLYPVLRALGVSDDELKEAWGKELFEKNYRAPSDNDRKDLVKVAKKLVGENIAPDLAVDAIKDAWSKSELDEETTAATLGRPYKNVDTSALLMAARRVLQVSRGESDEDVRDNQAYQSIHSAEDFIKDRLSRDRAGGLRKLLWRAAKTGKLDKAGGVLNKNIDALFDGTGLAHSVEDINPVETHDMRQSITRMGEGGISSEQSVSRAARGVQPSYLGVIDPTRGPEGTRLGLDLRATQYALKGSDNKLYTMVRDRTGKETPVSAEALSRATVAFPNELGSGESKVLAVKAGRMQYVRPEDVDFELPSPQSMFSTATNMIPFAQGVKGQRLLMGGRMTQQALPLAEGEAPLVQAADADGQSIYRKLGERAGAVRTPVAGRVTKVTADTIEVQTAEGPKRFDLYNHYPTARKTFINNTPLVKPGDMVQPGHLLARSNFTNDQGEVAVGRNLRAAWVVAEGDTLEDAFVISESAAKKMGAETMYRSEVLRRDMKASDKAGYRAIYRDKFKPEQYDALDDDGVIQPGSVVRYGDPLILAYQDKKVRAQGAVMDTPTSRHSDLTETWGKESPGVVTDVRKTRSGIHVAVKSLSAMKASDKLANRYGAKGVISRIVPDEEMPVDAAGQPVEVLVNALGIVSRTNPASLAEAALGKIAQRTGTRYDITNFKPGQKVTDYALEELRKAGIPEREDLYDPRTGRTIKNVFTGTTYLMQLHHTAEGKMSARDVAGYTLEGAPAKSGKESSKRIGTLDTGALVASGSTEFLRDAKLVRGQRNDDYWRELRHGGNPRLPTTNFANEAFLSRLQGAGVKVTRNGTEERLAPLLDRDTEQLGPVEITSGKTFDFNTMKPVPGGLFDPAATGGANGKRFARISLPKPVPHPLFVEPIQRLLGITGKELREVLAGRSELQGRTGPEAVQLALKSINIEREMEKQKAIVKQGRKTTRDKAVKTLNYLVGLQKTGTAPEDLMITQVPVVPPALRPISTSGKVDVIHDLNYLYNDLIEAKTNLSDAEQTFGDAGDEYLTMMDAVSAVSGMHDPVSQKSQEQRVKGILRAAIGVQGTPKAAAYQRNVIGTAVDSVARGTITSDPNLSMDEIGVPRSMARKIFRPYVMRRLVRSGHSAQSAIKMIEEKHPLAEKALVAEAETHPVVYNRAPALHQYSYVSGYAKLRDDNAIGLSYPVLGGLGADFDGDNINIHVPSSKAAVEEVTRTLLPSKNLISSGDFGPRMTPMQDYVVGLYMASTVDRNKEVKEFPSREAAMKAYKRGLIGPRDPIRIKA